MIETRKYMISNFSVGLLMAQVLNKMIVQGDHGEVVSDIEHEFDAGRMFAPHGIHWTTTKVVPDEV